MATSTTGTYTPKPGESDKFTKLKSVLYREEQDCRAWQDGELTDHRSQSFKYYNREKLGDEEPGQSQVVTSEYQDTVEAIMPALLRVFTSGDKVVEFSADNPQDQQWEDEATDYVSRVLMRENDGFVFWSWYIKDLLMYRLGWAAIDIEEKEEVKSKSFQNVPADAFALMSQQAQQMADDAEAELTIDAEPDESPETQPEMMLPVVQTFSGTLTSKRKVKKVVVDNIAPEDGLVSPMARHVDAASMTGYRKRVSASALKIMGLTDEEINELSPDELYTVEQAERQPDVIQATGERDTPNDSERQFWIVVAFVKYDWNDDGISELLRVVYAHAGGEPSQIIEFEEWKDGIAPVIPGSPILMSHTIPGKSIFDLVKDIQEIKTALMRGALDNMYLVNRPRPAVSDGVDLASLIDWTPGMPIRMRAGKKPTLDELTWVQVPPVADKTLMMMQEIDQTLQKRTGVTPNQQGVLDEGMNPTAQGANLAVAASSDRIDLIARTIAETAGKRLYRLIYKAVKRVAAGPITYRSGEDFKTIDPTKWPDDMQMEVSVGFGSANKQQQLQHLMLVGQGQEKLVQAQGGSNGPIVTPKHIANTFRRVLRTMGLKATDQYVASDKEIADGIAKQAQQPPPQNPEMVKAQAHIEAEKQKNAGDAQLGQQKHQADVQAQQQKTAADLQADSLKAANDLTLQREKNAGEIQLAREKMAAEMALKREEMMLNFQLKTQELAEEMKLKAQEVRAKVANGAGSEVQEQQLGNGA